MDTTNTDLARALMPAPTAAEPGQQVAAGSWGIEPFNDGYVTGQRFGNTVYVQNPNSMSHPVAVMVQLSKQKNPGLVYVMPGAGK